MEFGIFIQAHVPAARVEANADAEHEAIINETDLVRVADRHRWKYCWVVEHHFLTQYSCGSSATTSCPSSIRTRSTARHGSGSRPRSGPRPDRRPQQGATR